MKTAFDTNAMLFALLNGHTSIHGGVYVGDTRPENSTDEDIVVNTISVVQDALPQIGTSNINIYVADRSKKIKGNLQVSANLSRLKSLTDEVMEILRNANIIGCKAVPGAMTIMAEPETKQHFVNIRIDWNIQN